jgi:hypothetical protein
MPECTVVKAERMKNIISITNKCGTSQNFNISNYDEKYKKIVETKKFLKALIGTACADCKIRVLFNKFEKQLDDAKIQPDEKLKIYKALLKGFCDEKL